MRRAAPGRSTVAVPRPDGRGAPRRSPRAGDERSMTGIALIGYGHWGPNHARTFSQFNDSFVPIVADIDRRRLEAVPQQFPGTEVTTDYDEVFSHPKVDAVVIATPLTTHHSLVKAALNAGKD